jgi:hypothetical protein
MPADLAPPHVDFAPAYVLGYPMHAAITVRLSSGSPNLLVSGGLPVASIFEPAGFSGRVEDEHGDVATFTIGPGDHEHAEGGALRAGEARRMLIDLADFHLGSFAPGTYRWTLAYAGVEAATFTTSLRAPSEVERAEVAALRALAPSAVTWGAWALDPAAPIAERVERSDPLRYIRVLAHAFNAPDTANVPLDALDGLYAPEARILHLELTLLHGGPFAAEAATVRRDHPELDHLVEDLETGGSFIGLVRAQRALLAGP